MADRLLAGKKFKSSKNDYDWLGPGIYFWEGNPRRGIEYAQELKKLKRLKGPKVQKPAVVGAVIDLGICLDLTTTAGLQQIKAAYSRLKDVAGKADWSLPKNSNDLMQRKLDCAVIQYLHRIREETSEPRIDTIRGVFIEGRQLYPDAGIYDKTHIQICVCNPCNIKGVFRVENRFLA